MQEVQAVVEGIPVTAPGDFNSLVDLIKYGWVPGLAWVTALMKRIKKLEDQALLAPSTVEMHSHVKEVVSTAELSIEKTVGKMDRKLDRIERLLWDWNKSGTNPTYDLGSKR